MAHQRPSHHPFKQLPLTGAFQSLLTEYLLSNSFGRIVIPNEYGQYEDANLAENTVSAALVSCHREFETDEKGTVTIFCLPSEDVATDHDIEQDARAWSISFARDQRAGVVQNHEHAGTGTCIKYQKKSKKQPDEAREHGENANVGAGKHDENADV